jgi:hypothetical protein
MQSRRGLQLDRIVLLGRTFEEYRRYFLLEPDDLMGKRVLDFCAEANQLGINVTSFDPIYSLPPEKITERSEPDLESVYRVIGSVPTYRWGYYKNPRIHARIAETRLHYLSLGLQDSPGALRSWRVAETIVRGR